jgi:hypothetical protein
MKKLLSAAFVSLAVGAAPLMAAPTIGDLTKGLDTFTTDVPKSLPFAADSGIDWSSAYIGNLINADFPFVHFGLGATGGFTSIPATAFKPLVTGLGQSFDLSFVPLPFVNINGRIGGLVLPFDVGFKLGFVPSAFSSYGGYQISYNTWGADVRYSVIKSNLVFPDIMVGVGVSGLNAGVTKSFGKQAQYTVSTHTLTVTAPKLTVDLSSVEYEAKAQISKGILFVTPYAGLGVGYGTGNAKAGIKSNVSDNLGSLAFWKTYLPDVSSTGFSQSSNAGVFNTRVYGGMSFDFLALKLDLQGQYSVLDGAFGGSIGARLQL